MKQLVEVQARSLKTLYYGGLELEIHTTPNAIWRIFFDAIDNKKRIFLRARAAQFVVYPG